MIDTRNKRASAVFPLLPFRAILPAPDGAVNQADRQTIAFLYSGILAGVGATISGKVFVTWSIAKPAVAWTSRQPAVTWSVSRDDS